MYPLILGHENSGIIDRVGDGVSESYIGKHAAIIPLVPCFECEECKRGYYSACHKYSFIGSRQSGGFAEFVDLPEKNVFILPDSLPFEHAALIEPSTVARHMLALGDFKRGQTAIVLGAGSIGLMIVQWLRILGADRIIVTDILEDKIRLLELHASQVTKTNIENLRITEVAKSCANFRGVQGRVRYAEGFRGLRVLRNIDDKTCL